jgi:hypothetical protein
MIVEINITDLPFLGGTNIIRPRCFYESGRMLFVPTKN